MKIEVEKDGSRSMKLARSAAAVLHAKPASLLWGLGHASIPVHVGQHLHMTNTMIKRINLLLFLHQLLGKFLGNKGPC